MHPWRRARKLCGCVETNRRQWRIRNISSSIPQPQQTRVAIENFTSFPMCQESFSGQGVGLVLLHYKMLPFKNKYHYWWQLSKRTENNNIRYNLFRQDRMFESSPTKSPQFTSCNAVCILAPSQGKELSLKSRLSCNHHRAVVLSRFGVRSAKDKACPLLHKCLMHMNRDLRGCLYQRGRANSAICKTAWKKWYPCNRDKQKETILQ